MKYLKFVFTKSVRFEGEKKIIEHRIFKPIEEENEKADESFTERKN